MQENIAGLRVQCLNIWAKLACAQLIRHGTSEPVIISWIRSILTGGNFLAVVNHLMPILPFLYFRDTVLMIIGCTYQNKNIWKPIKSCNNPQYGYNNLRSYGCTDGFNFQWVTNGEKPESVNLTRVIPFRENWFNVRCLCFRAVLKVFCLLLLGFLRYSLILNFKF